MVNLLQIANRIIGNNPIAIPITYNLDEGSDTWEGNTPERILQEFQKNETVFNSIQKKPFIHLIVKGESILSKTFNIQASINSQNFLTEFPNFNSETTIVSASIMSTDMGLALFLPQFKLTSILENLNPENFTIAQVSLCNSSQSIDHISFRNNISEIAENNVNAHWFHAFKVMSVKGSIFLIALFALFFTIDKIQLNFLKNQNSENSIIKAQILSLEEIEKKIIVNQNLISANTNNITEFKHPVLNQVALSCPKEVRLLKIQLNPISGKISPDKQITFENNLIRVKGNTNNLPVLHSWIKKLKTKEWVRNIEIIEINNNSDRNSLEFHFNITKN